MYVCLQVFTVLIQSESLFCNSVADVVSLVCSNTAASRNIGLRKGKIVHKIRKNKPTNEK